MNYHTLLKREFAAAQAAQKLTLTTIRSSYTFAAAQAAQKCNGQTLRNRRLFAAAQAAQKIALNQSFVAG